jgi:uncharacterized YccA/Bax inhibitor family protein
MRSKGLIIGVIGGMLFVVITEFGRWVIGNESLFDYVLGR